MFIRPLALIALLLDSIQHAFTGPEKKSGVPSVFLSHFLAAALFCHHFTLGKWLHINGITAVQSRIMTISMNIRQPHWPRSQMFIQSNSFDVGVWHKSAALSPHFVPYWSMNVIVFPFFGLPSIQMNRLVKCGGNRRFRCIGAFCRCQLCCCHLLTALCFAGGCF